MTPRDSTSTMPPILWKQIWGVSALMAATLLGWIIFQFSYPDLLALTQYGQRVEQLGIGLGLLGAALEPAIGLFSDRLSQPRGQRFSLIIGGVVVTVVGMAAIALLLPLALQAAVGWLILPLLVLWALGAMVVGVSTMALLAQFAPTPYLARANACLISIVAGVAVIGVLISQQVSQIGLGPLLLLSAAMLMLGAWLLHASDPKQSLLPIPATTPSMRASFVFVTFGVGLGAGIEITSLLGAFPDALHQELPQLETAWMTPGMLAIVAIAAIPLQRWLSHHRVQRMMLVALAAIPTLMGLGMMVNSRQLAIAIIPFLGIALALLLINQIPYAIRMLPATRAGLSTGLYLGGMGTGLALSLLLTAQSGSVDPTSELLWTAVGFLIASSCIQQTYPRSVS